MLLRALEQSNHLIDENRRRIDLFRAEIAIAGSGECALRLRVLQQMELSLACLERHRDEIASRLAKDALDGQGA